jgi:hypothetical protein
MVFLVIIIAAFLLQMVLPWWVIIIITFATCGIIGKTGKISFWQPFLAIFALWIVMALFKSLPNDNVLATRVAEMLSVKLWPIVLLLTGVLGGLAAGICGYCGYQFRKAVISMKTHPQKA